MKSRQSVAVVPVQHLTAHPGNVRQDLGDLTEMAASIRVHGILQPLTVTEHGDDPDRFILLVGHRRLAAALIAGLTTVPVIVRHHVDEADQIALMLVENIHRQDLDPIERAEAFAALIHQGLTQAEVARRVGTHPGNVSRSLVLLDLPDWERDEIRRGERGAHAAISEHRQTRNGEREAEGRPAMGTKFRRRTDAYFSASHRLAPTVRKLCTHKGRSQVGEVGCGPCWEQAIREAPALAVVPDEPDVDPVVVERILGGDYTHPATKGERAAVVVDDSHVPLPTEDTE